MNKVLVLFAHPVYQTSLLNRTLLEGLESTAQVTVHDLYEHYPDFMIDVAHEQNLLNAHDVIVFQHPLYWYSCPALLKEWMDLVLEHGYAYGTGANALQDKIFISSITSGGDAANYEGERNIRDLLKPFEHTARLCNMQFLPPFITYGGLKIKAGNFDQLLTKEYLTEQRERFRALLDDLVHQRINEANCLAFDTMNDRFDQLEIQHD